jgi:hypothetical protein
MEHLGDLATDGRRFLELIIKRQGLDSSATGHKVEWQEIENSAIKSPVSCNAETLIRDWKIPENNSSNGVA